LLIVTASPVILPVPSTLKPLKIEPSSPRPTTELESNVNSVVSGKMFKPTKFSVRVALLKTALAVVPSAKDVLWPRLVVLRLNTRLALLNVVVPLAVMVRTLAVSLEPVPGCTVPLIVLLELAMVPVPVRTVPVSTLRLPLPVAEPVLFAAPRVPLTTSVPPV